VSFILTLPEHSEEKGSKENRAGSNPPDKRRQGNSQL